MPPVQSLGPALDRGSAPAARELIVDAEGAGQRLDHWIAERLAIGRRAAARVIASARRNGHPARKGERVAAGDLISIDCERPDAIGHSEAADDAPRVISATDQVAVIDKPAGLASVSLAGRPGASVAQWAAMTFPECAGVGRPGENGVAHRLDTGTSGLLLIARTATAYTALRDQFDRRTIEKSYLAIVEGALAERRLLDTPIGQHPKSRRRMRCVSREDASLRYRVRAAATIVEPIEGIGTATLVRATTCSGVRHQIRVHLADAGHPLLGDVLYGASPLTGSSPYFLHAECIRWKDPATGGLREEIAGEPSAWASIRNRLSQREEPTRGLPSADTAPAD